MSIHHLKINKQPFDDLVSGRKPGEGRDCSNRDFKVGDSVELFMTETSTGLATESIVRTITHIQRGYGLPDDICVLSYAAPVVERQREIDGVNCQNPECSALIPHGAKCGYCAPPELAELQATIARLTAENERLRAGVGSDMAEIDRIQGEYDKQFRKVRELKAEIERLKGGQREPVSVVMPERGGISNRPNFNEGWNACLDKMKELNQ